MANNADIWEDEVKPKLAAELGLPDPHSEHVDIYNAINTMIVNAVPTTPVLLRRPMLESSSDSESDDEDDEVLTHSIPFGPGLSNNTLNSTLVGCYADSHNEFVGGAQAGCGTHNNRRLAVVAGSSSHGVGVSTPDFVMMDGMSGFCAYYEWDDVTDIKPSVSMRSGGSVTKSSVLVETPVQLDDTEWAYGVPVALKKNKLVVAEVGDDILGVTCPPMGVVANAQELEWHGKYEKTQFGATKTRISYTTVLVDCLQADGSDKYIDIIRVLMANDKPNALELLTTQQRRQISHFSLTPIYVHVLSPAYDPSRAYIPRRLRQEWVPVCYSGLVRVRREYSHLMTHAKQLSHSGNTLVFHI
jgi:hypothetical protein